MVHQVERGCLIHKEGGGQLLGFCCFKTKSICLDEGCRSVVSRQASVVVTVEQIISSEVFSELLVNHVLCQEAKLDGVRERAIVVENVSVSLLVVGVYDLFLPHCSKHPG